MNSYMSYRSAYRPMLETAFAKHGMRRLSILAFLSYLISNLREGEADAATVDFLLNLAWDGAPPVGEEREQMGKLVNYCFAINDRFREETAHAYFRLYGCEQEFIEIGRSDF